jgi:hypothetical protein
MIETTTNIEIHTNSMQEKKTRATMHELHYQCDSRAHLTTFFVAT